MLTSHAPSGWDQSPKWIYYSVWGIIFQMGNKFEVPKMDNFHFAKN